MLEQALRDNRIHPTNLVLGVAFIKGLPKRKALDCLKFRREIMQELLRHLVKADKEGGKNIPFPWAFFMRGTIDHLKNGIKRINDLTKHIQRMQSWK